MPPKKRKGPKPVDSLKHKETRISIPTEELREFVRDDEEAPRAMLYPRDPSLDPQLVWKGKDEQDSEPLEVPVVPIYIQEKIHPQALIENLRETAKAGEPEPELTLFDDFNGISSFEDKVTSFYSHDAGRQPHWSNRMILGDSLLVMTSLAEKEGLKGKVQMIYMDPPYGIKFGVNWQVSTRKRQVVDGNVGRFAPDGTVQRPSDLTAQPEQIKAFRDTWRLGIHSYLAYLRDRLAVARDLLTESGSVFVQIGEENVHLVRGILDETFGSQSFCGEITFRTTGGQSSALISSEMDYLLWYARDKESAKKKFRQPVAEKPFGRGGSAQYVLVQADGEEPRAMTDAELDDPERLPAGARVLAHDTLFSQGPPSDEAERRFTWRGQTCECPVNNHWKASVRNGGMRRLVLADRLMGSPSYPRYKRFYDDYPVVEIGNVWMDTTRSGFARKKQYIVETNTIVVERCMQMCTDPGDLVIDPTCGSGTTAVVAEHWGRRWITIDTSRVALALARARLMTARFPHFLLADSDEGRRKEAELTGAVSALQVAAPPTLDVRMGFVSQRVPHVKLGSIANNEEIDSIHDRYAERIDPLIAAFAGHLPKAKGKAKGPEAPPEEWQIPREIDPGWPAKVKKAHEELWRLKRERQAEIDASIARRADTELLYDKPYQDLKRIRVTGPFTVESLSPHRVLSTEEERPASERAGDTASAASFAQTILDNLQKAGVQNTRKDERLKFDRLEAYPGTWIHFAGEFTQKDGKSRRVAVSLGPEHGTVGPKQIQEAAKEATRGIPFDMLLVLGFSFDGRSAEVAKTITPAGLSLEEGFTVGWEEQLGRLPVLLVRMNPDLAMGEELLKKTGSGNLFLVFGEPDVEIREVEEGKLQVEIRGVDVYDPTTGVVRSSSTDDIACWFLDTNYDEESFFVRHAYFTGEGDPYDKLKRALRADIDEAAWSTLYSTVSRPFDRPATGKIAVKVINHYGDEVLKVYRVS